MGVGGEFVGVFRSRQVALSEISLVVALLGLIFVVGSQSEGNLTKVSPCMQFKTGGAQIQSFRTNCGKTNLDGSNRDLRQVDI